MASTYHGLSRGLQNTRDDARMSFGETGGSVMLYNIPRDRCLYMLIIRLQLFLVVHYWIELSLVVLQVG